MALTCLFGVPNAGEASDMPIWVLRLQRALRRKSVSLAEAGKLAAARRRTTRERSKVGMTRWVWARDEDHAIWRASYHLSYKTQEEAKNAEPKPPLTDPQYELYRVEVAKEIA
jgi:hypothetical protein